MRWSDGYVVEVPFPDQVVRPALPSWIGLVSSLNGQPPVPVDRSIHYVELGCGTGRTATAVAASWPGVEVWACDINPSHVEEARRLARVAGLSNCVFAEASFRQAFEQCLGPQEADIIVITGIWSWLSQANQQFVVDFIAERLAPGGVVCVGYSVESGSSAFAPIREIMRLAAEADPRPLVETVPDILDLVGEVVKSLPDADGDDDAERVVTPIRKMSAEYVAHDYFSRDYRPSSFVEMHDRMGEAKCSFLGSADPTGHIATLSVGETMIDTVIGTPDVRMREMLRDLSLARSSRTDLFRRGLASTPDVRRSAWVERSVFASLGREFDPAMKVKVAVGEAELNDRYHGALLSRLALGPMSLAEVGELSVFEGLPFEEAVSVMCLLVAGGYAAPVVPGWERAETRQSARRLNQALIDDNRQGYSHSFLVSPVTGCDVAVEYLESLTLGNIWETGLADADELTERALVDLQRQGRSVARDGLAVTDTDDARPVVRSLVERALDRAAGVWTQLGVCGFD